MKFEQVKLGDLYDIASGLSKGKAYFGHGFPFLTFKTVFENYFLPDELSDLAYTTEKERATCSIRRGDVFLTRTSENTDELGMSCVALKNYPDATFNGFTKRLRPKDDMEINPVFAGYWFRSQYFRELVKSMAVMTTRASLNNEMIQRLTMPLPSIETQNAIAQILFPLDEKIAGNTVINHHLEQMAQAIFKSWFVDFEPFGGAMPVDWREGTLSEIANVTMGQSPEGSSYNADGIGTVFYQGRAEFGSRFPTRRLFTTQPKRMAAKGDVLMSVRAPVGDLNVAFEACCLGRGLASIQSNNGDQSFILYTMSALKQQLDMFNGEGTVFGSINKNDMANIPVLIPNDEVLRKFEELVNPMDATIEANYAESRYLATLRDILLPRLMSGELPIKTI